MIDILRIYFDNGYNLTLFVNKYLLFITIALFSIIIMCKLLVAKGYKTIEVDEVEIGIGDSKIKLKPNYADKQIAYQLWVEIVTRKLGLTFEEDRDVIIDVYQSWYQFFGITRNIIKEIPVQKFKNQSSNLVWISVNVLNCGIRPHLTTWYARYTHWYNTEGVKLNLSPQECQKCFPLYSELINDLNGTNKKMIAYGRILYLIAFENQRISSYS